MLSIILVGFTILGAVAFKLVFFHTRETPAGTTSIPGPKGRCLLPSIALLSIVF
jgi:hypothetical protein